MDVELFKQQALRADGPAPEIKCDACGGTGRPPAKEVAPGRRIYPAPCTKCGGKGRLSKSGRG